MAALGVTYPVLSVFYFVLICDVWHFEGFACGGHDGEHLNHTRNIKNCQVKHQSFTGGWDKVSSDLSVAMALRASLALGSLPPLDFRSGAENATILPGFKRFYQVLTSVASQEEMLPTISQWKTSHCEKWLVFVVLHLCLPTQRHFAMSAECICWKTHQNTSVIFKNKSTFLILFLPVKKIPANEKTLKHGLHMQPFSAKACRYFKPRPVFLKVNISDLEISKWWKFKLLVMGIVSEDRQNLKSFSDKQFLET